MLTAAIIPARNEAKRIRSVVQATLAYVDYVIVVDDGSIDTTVEQVRGLDPKVLVLEHEVNLGKGAALKTGCDAAIQLKVDAMVCLDADGQHNPQRIVDFFRLLEDTPVDVVFGMRPFNNRMPLVMLAGNRFLSTLIKTLFKVMVHDTQAGFRAFTSSAYRELRWHSSGYEVETEMIVRTGEHHLRYAEIEIETIYHDQYKGTTVLDGFRILLSILRWKLI